MKGEQISQEDTQLQKERIAATDVAKAMSVKKERKERKEKDEPGVLRYTSLFKYR